MLQGQINKEKKVAHRGNFNQAPTSNGVVRKGHISNRGFVGPNSEGARIIDADRYRFLTGMERGLINEKQPLSSQPPNQIEANKTLLPLGMLQDSQTQFPFIAQIPTNFVYKKEQEFVKEEREEEHIKEAETILNRVEQIHKQRVSPKFV